MSMRDEAHRASKPNANTTTLADLTFVPLPLGSIKPRGWLLDQMNLMRDGLAGHGFDFYQYVHSSPWMGGHDEYSELNEAFPYWFNGLVPLAYGLDDDRLKGQVKAAVDYVLGHQAEDGWIGPERIHSERAIWGRFPFFLGLIQLAEANSTEAKRIVPALHRFMILLHSMMQDDHAGYRSHPDDEFDPQWGMSRSHDMIITLQWLYEKHPANNSQVLLDNMHSLHEEAYDWQHWFSEGVFPKKPRNELPWDWVERHFPFEHGVNAAQGLKAGAVMRRFIDNDTLLESARRGVNLTYTYHGTASGTIIADEVLQGLSPTSGSELCTAVEIMYSLSYLYHAMGDRIFADYGELAAFNAMPVMISPDWWSHQYLTQANQPQATDLTETPFWNVGNQGIIYGLEPNYPCCTANHPQGYPKFLAASVVRVGTNGLGHALLAPFEAVTSLGDGHKVTIRCDTHYPFDLAFTYTITTDTAFDFHVRVPNWTQSSASTFTLNALATSPISPDPHTGMQRISIPAGTSTILYQLSATITIQPRPHDTVAIRHGALLYSLDIAQQVKRQPARHYGSAGPLPARFQTNYTHDYQISSASPWAVAIDPSSARFHRNATDKLKSPIWARGAPPTWITIQACEIAWGMNSGVIAEPPRKGHRRCLGDMFEARMIPFGAAKLHMSELPVVDPRVVQDGVLEL